MTRPVLLVLSAAILTACGGSAVPVGDMPSGVLAIDTAGGEVRFEVSIAETAEARTRGLMGIEELADGSGMVFLEPQPVQASFWMKDTLIPLSIAFWDQDGGILAILDMEPCREDPCEMYGPGVSWIGALEVNRGAFAERGVEVGDRVTLER